MRQKRIVFIILSLVLLAGFAFGASLPLQGNWTPPTTDLNGSPLVGPVTFNLYETDSGRIQINSSPILTPPFNFSIIKPDGTSGTATFVITAINPGGESADSNVASYPFALVPAAPAAPAGFSVITQPVTKKPSPPKIK
jgi:hypothetical protein